MRTLTLALVGTLLSSTALAKKKDRGAENWARKDGVSALGAGPTLGGTLGGQFRYFFSPEAGLLVTLGGSNQSLTLDPDSGSSTKTKTGTLGLGLYGEYKFVKGKKTALAGMLGVDLANTSWDYGGNADGSYTDLTIGLGLKGEIFLAPKFSVYSQLGLSVDPAGDAEVYENGLDPDDYSASGMTVTWGGHPLGLAGFSFWFD